MPFILVVIKIEVVLSSIAGGSGHIARDADIYQEKCAGC